MVALPSMNAMPIVTWLVVVEAAMPTDVGFCCTIPAAEEVEEVVVCFLCLEYAEVNAAPGGRCSGASSRFATSESNSSRPGRSTDSKAATSNTSMTRDATPKPNVRNRSSEGIQ